MSSNVVFTATFNQLLENQFDFLAQKIGAAKAQDLIASTVSRFAQRVSEHPHSVPLCLELAELGLQGYYDDIDTEAQLRIIYRLSTEQRVYALLLLSTRQSVQRALIQYCLMK